MSNSTIKPGYSKTAGDDYQKWVGVYLICNWLRNQTEFQDAKLEQEIGTQKYGIFDDIMEETSENRKFYQIKHTEALKGGLISLTNDILNEESDISIEKMYSSFKKIREHFTDKDFKLIVYSNKSVDESLSKCLDQSQFHETILNLNSNVRIEANRKILIDKLKILDENVDFIKNFLIKLHFILGQEKLAGLKAFCKNQLGIMSDYIENIVDETMKYHKRIYMKDLLGYLELKEKISYLDYITKFIRVGISSFRPVCEVEGNKYCLDLQKYDIQESEQVDWESIRNDIKALYDEMISKESLKKILFTVTSPLSVGFLLGYIFMKPTGFDITIRQNQELWSINDEFGSNCPLKFQERKGDGTDLIVIIDIENRFIRKTLDQYLHSHPISYRTIIEFSSQSSMKGKEVTSIITEIISSLRKNKEVLAITHIFMAGPVALAILLGTSFNMLTPIQLYEINKKTNQYQKCFFLQ